MSGLQDRFDGQVEIVLLDLDDSRQDNIRRRLGITAQAQYLLVNDEGRIIGRWFGLLDEARVGSEIASLIQT